MAIFDSVDSLNGYNRVILLMTFRDDNNLMNSKDGKYSNETLCGIAKLYQTNMLHYYIRVKSRVINRENHK